MNKDEESSIRFGLGLKNTGDIVNEVQDLFDILYSERQLERQRFKIEIAKLEKENQEYRRVYLDQWYNDREIERSWAAIGDYNRPHLELHEAITEKKRELENDQEKENLEKEVSGWWKWWNDFGFYWYTKHNHPYCEKPPFLKQNDPLFELNSNKK
jgi:hypothetical protein